MVGKIDVWQITRHIAYMQKAQTRIIVLMMLDWIWFDCQHFHCTRYAGECSSLLDGCSGESQRYSRFWTGSSLVHSHSSRPASDYTRNSYFQICRRHVPCGTARRQTQVVDYRWTISHVEAWASRNNLRLNRTKSKQLIFSAITRENCGQSSQPPPPCPNIERVGCAKVLGITLNDRLSATDHVNNLLTSCSSLLYVMKVLRGHGISTESLHDVFRAIVLAKITYCLPAWSGPCSASDRAKLDSFLNRCKRLVFCENTVFTIPAYQTF